MTQFNSSTLNRYLVNRYSPAFFGVRGYLEYNQACQTTDGRSWYRGSADALRRSLLVMMENVDRADMPEDILVAPAQQIHDVVSPGLSHVGLRSSAGGGGGGA